MAAVTFDPQNTQKTFSTSSPAATVSGLPNQSVPAPGTATTTGPPATTTPLFGSVQAPSPAPTTPGASGGLFGAPTPAPAPFGATTGGLFGAPTPAPAPFGTSTGAFGSIAPAPTTFGSPTGGLFGAAAPNPASGGLFSSSNSTFGGTSSLGTSTGLFGAPSPGGSRLFGANTSSTQQQQAASSQVPNAYNAMHMLHNAEDRQFQEETTALLKEFGLVYSLQMPARSRTESAPFTTTLYNPASPTYQQQVWMTIGNSGNSNARPLLPAQATQLSTSDWVLACANAPQGYEPVTCLGANGLIGRISTQQVDAQLLSSQVKDLLKVMETLKERRETALRQGHDAKMYRLRTDRRGRLWRIMQKLEFCRAYQQPLKDEERVASAHLDRLLKETEAASLVQLPTTNDAVMQEFPPFVTPNGEHPIDPAIVRARLVEHRQLLIELIHSVKKDLRDVKLLAERFQD